MDGQINPASFKFTDFLQAYRGGTPFKVRNKDVIALYQEYISGGGGGHVLTEVAAFDFGSENDSIVVTVSSALITTTNITGATFIPQSTTATSLDDFSLNGLSFRIENIVNSTSFDIRATASNCASGIYTVKYIINYT